MNKELENLLNLAELGDSEALSRLGEYYLDNSNELNYVEYYEKAIEYFKKSASLGNSNGLYNLGLCYENGIGTKKDFNRALAYFLEAANNIQSDYPKIQNKIASCYANRGEFKQAIEWYTKGAENRDIDSLNALGYIYLNGCGVKKNIEKAIQYLIQSVSQEDPYSMNLLGSIYSDEESEYFNPQKAFLLYTEAADLGFPYAMLNVSEAYLEGNGCEVNISKGIKYLLDTIDVWGEGDSIGPYPTEWQIDAHERLSNLLQNELFLENLKEIALNENRVAQYYMFMFLNDTLLLGSHDFNNISIQRENLKWLIKSADNGFPQAQNELGQCYNLGIGGCEKNIQKAMKYLSAAANQGHSGAIFYLQSLGK